MREHPAAETIAAFAEGRLRRAEVMALSAHLARCPACRAAVEAANEAFAAERPAQTGRVRTWWIAAAAMAAAIAIVAVLVPMRNSSGTSRLVALVPSDRRLVEPRLSGGFPYAPYRGPMRGPEAARNPKTMKLIGAAGELVERADRDPSPDAQHAAGVAVLLADGGEDAVTRLRAAAASAPQDASPWSDVAAAEYAEALRAGQTSRYPLALAAADRALRIDAKHPEALFNRALILQRLGLADEARAAWQRYLAVDATSAWATEARNRLRRLPAQTGESLFKRELPRLERAVAAGDYATVRSIVSRYPQQSRGWAEAEWPAQWAEALGRGDRAAAARALSAARETGDALLATTGESLLHDAVALLGEGREATKLAAAYTTYRNGRKAYAAGRPQEAEPLLREAAHGFAAAGSPMGYVARYYAASARFDQNDATGARAELETLLAEMSRVPRYAAATAQVQWELGLCHMSAGDWNAAVPLLATAEATFTRLGERGHAAFVSTLLADTLASLGRPDESWSARVRSFEILSREGRSMRLAVSLGAASRIDLRVGRLDAARALLRLEQTADQALGNDALLADALLREAVLAAKLGDDAGAALAANDAGRVAARIADPELRARAQADVSFAAGAVALTSDAPQAKRLLTRAIDVYERRGLPLYLTEALLLRARAARRTGHAADAAADVAAGITAIEQSPIQLAGGVTGTGVHDAANALFEEAVTLALDRGDTAGAFAYAERGRLVAAHAPSEAVPAGELTKRLHGSGVAVIELVALPEEVIVFAIDAHGLEVHRCKTARAAVAELARQAHKAETTAALYDLLIRPAEGMLARNGQAIIVADPLLAGVPFAALYDRTRGRYLVESIAVAMAESASVLTRRTPAPVRQVLSVTLPTGELAALPDGLAEARELQGLYPRVIELTADHATLPAFLAGARQSEVIHLAGHTQRQAGLGDAALLFADRPVTWSTVAGSQLAITQVVVLAACETLRVPAARDARTLSLGAAFAAAGARDVLGTLTPIADADARALFLDFHQQLAAGATASAALRQTQLHAIARHDSGAWRALALLTRHV